MLKRNVFIMLFVCFVYIFNFNLRPVSALTTSKLSAYPQVEYLLGAMAIESGVVWQSQSNLNQYINSVLAESGLTISNFASIVVNNSCTIPGWLVTNVNSVLQDLKGNPVFTVDSSLLNQNWNNYSNTPVLSADYPYQAILDYNGYRWLLVSNFPIYYTGTYNVQSGALYKLYMWNSGWSLSDSGTGVVHTVGGNVLQCNYPVYQSDLTTVKSSATISGTTSTSYDFTQDMSKTSTYPQTTAQTGDVYVIPSSPVPSSLVGVTSLSSTGITTATSTSVAHTDSVGIMDSIKALPSQMVDGFQTMLTTLFVPSSDYWKNKFDDINTTVSSRFPQANLDGLVALENGEDWVFTDVYVDLMGGHCKIIDASSVNNYLPKIQFWLGGLVGFLLILYNYNQLYFLIRKTYPIVTSNTTTVNGKEV